MAMRGFPIKRLYNKKYYKLGTIIYTFNMCWYLFQTYNRNGVIVSVLASSGVDCGFEPRSGQNKDYTIGICCFSGSA
jgi:hypothetical protein